MAIYVRPKHRCFALYGLIGCRCSVVSSIGFGFDVLVFSLSEGGQTYRPVPFLLPLAGAPFLET